MKLTIDKQLKHAVPEGMIGLFFEDINYSADGGLYAEMIENRSFEFYKAGVDWNDYYAEYDGAYAWRACAGLEACANLRLVTGSPHSEINPHYMRLSTKGDNCGLCNKAYSGLYLEKGKSYEVTFWARKVRFEGDFRVEAVKDGKVCGKVIIGGDAGTDETYNFWKKYTGTLTATETVKGAEFALLLTKAGVVEFDYISMFPQDAVAGLFRKDLFDKLAELKPGFLRFPGGCIVEGNTYYDRYDYKKTLMMPWDRKNLWSRWAVHGACAENGFETQYAHYNQSFGLGFYEYFLLCELIGAKPLPVLNVGLACQFQSREQVALDSPEFKQVVQDGIDLIEFANGSVDTKWGSVRAWLGHPEPFGLELLGIGNEQWQTEEVDFFSRYEAFEKAIHTYDPSIKLIGSAGPDITSEKYTAAWDFYRSKANGAETCECAGVPGTNGSQFVHAIDEHYYVPPQWLFDHVDFYDNYDRKFKVFSGEYAAHPCNGMNMPQANTLEGALAEAAFMTGLERNCDVVILASYAPLFARLGYAQWSPDMIWFDEATSYGSPSYYVQQMYGQNMGDFTLETGGQEKELAKEKLYYSVSYAKETDEIIIKIVNGADAEQKVEVALGEGWNAVGADAQAAGAKKTYRMTLLTCEDKDASNSIEQPCKVAPVKVEGSVTEGITLPAHSFAVVRI